jgi:integral membrane protein
MIASLIGRVRIIGFLEGLSYLVLLAIAMPLKYVLGLPEAVRIVGMAHGILFIAFIFLTLQAKFVYDWPMRKLLLFWLASIVPFGTFYIDYKMLRAEYSAEKAGR